MSLVPKKPRRRSDLVVVEAGNDEGYVLFSEEGSTLLKEGLPSLLWDIADGETTTESIAASLAPEHSPVAVVRGIQRLHEMELLAVGDAVESTSESAFWDRLHVAPTVAHDTITSTRVGVLDLVGTYGERLERALSEAGLTVVATDSDGHADNSAGAHITVVITDSYLRPELAEINTSMIESGHRWVLFNPAGGSSWIGPLFSEDAACWDCLRQRLTSNNMVTTFLKTFRGLTSDPVVSVSAVPSSTQLAMSVLAQALVLELGAQAHQLVGNLLTVDGGTLSIERHPVVRQPQCRACGAGALTEQQPVKFEPATVRPGHFSGFRTCPPTETLKRLEAHVSPLTGVITMLHSQHDEDEQTFHAYGAGHNFAILRDSVETLRRNLRGNSGGKGRTDIDARAGAMCEAVERYSGVWTPDRPTTVGTQDSIPLRSYAPNDLMLFSDAQFEQRDITNPIPVNRMNQVPLRYDPVDPISWSKVWSLTKQEFVFVPSAYCWFGHPDSTSNFVTYSDGNGNASGNTLSEAVLQGLLELTERDAVGMWWYNRTTRPQLDLDKIGDYYIDEVRDRYRQMGRTLWVLDLTSDLGIPVFGAVSVNEVRSTEDILVAFGAHFDPTVALNRAITELNQFLPGVIGEDGHGNTEFLMDEPAALDWWMNARVENESWLRPAPNSELVVPRPLELEGETDIADFVDMAVDRFQQAGLEVLVLDQTRPEIGLPVAKVMAPGIRHFWRRLAPGRLYDVPVAMGEVAEKRSEAELNPWSVFF